MTQRGRTAGGAPSRSGHWDADLFQTNRPEWLSSEKAGLFFPRRHSRMAWLFRCVLFYIEEVLLCQIVHWACAV